MNFSMKFMRPKSDARRPPLPAALAIEEQAAYYVVRDAKEPGRRSAAKLLTKDLARSLKIIEPSLTTR